MITNYMEQLVDKYLKEVFEKNPDYSEICKSETCIDDIKAKALNNLPPLYYTRKQGEAHGEFYGFDSQNKADIVSEIAKAIHVIRGNMNNQ
jgi:competence protein ComFB